MPSRNPNDSYEAWAMRLLRMDEEHADAILAADTWDAFAARNLGGASPRQIEALEEARENILQRSDVRGFINARTGASTFRDPSTGRFIARLAGLGRLFGRILGK